MRQVLILQKKTRRKCAEMKNGKNRKGGRRELKIRRFLKLNNPHKVPFWIKVKWNITTRNPMVRVQKGMTTSLHQWSWSHIPRRLIWHQNESKGSQMTRRKESRRARFVGWKTDFAAKDLAQVYNKNCMSRHVVLLLLINWQEILMI